MNRYWSIVVAVSVFSLPASAQEAPPPKPELIIGGQPGPTVRDRCVEVEIGGARSFGCLNQKLKRDVDKVAPVANVAPLDAKSGDTKIGIVNLPGVQQQYGRNYGVSVVPFRLPQPAFRGPSTLR